jgi:hypothetical protein
MQHQGVPLNKSGKLDSKSGKLDCKSGKLDNKAGRLHCKSGKLLQSYHNFMPICQTEIKDRSMNLLILFTGFW